MLELTEILRQGCGKGRRRSSACVSWRVSLENHEVLCVALQSIPLHYFFRSSSLSFLISFSAAELCLESLNRLCRSGAIVMDEDVNLEATGIGRAMAKFCMSLETAEQFAPLTQSTVADFVCGNKPTSLKEKLNGIFKTLFTICSANKSSTCTSISTYPLFISPFNK
jgi:hypothetical protein